MFGANCCWHILHDGQHMRQRFMRGRPLLCLKRVRHQLRGVRRLKRQMQRMQTGQLRQRRLQVLRERSGRGIVLGRRLVYQQLLRGRPLLCVDVLRF